MVDPQNLAACILNDAYMINPMSILFIYGFFSLIFTANCYFLILYIIHSDYTHLQGFPPDSQFGSFYPQNRVRGPKNLAACVLIGVYMMNPISVLFIYGFLF